MAESNSFLEALGLKKGDAMTQDGACKVAMAVLKFVSQPQRVKQLAQIATTFKSTLPLDHHEMLCFFLEPSFAELGSKALRPHPMDLTHVLTNAPPEEVIGRDSLVELSTKKAVAPAHFLLVRVEYNYVDQLCVTQDVLINLTVPLVVMKKRCIVCQELSTKHCGVCKTPYCGVIHQKEHWATHKTTCKAVN